MFSVEGRVRIVARRYGIFAPDATIASLDDQFSSAFSFEAGLCCSNRSFLRVVNTTCTTRIVPLLRPTVISFGDGAIASFSAHTTQSKLMKAVVQVNPNFSAKRGPSSPSPSKVSLSGVLAGDDCRLAHRRLGIRGAN